MQTFTQALPADPIKENYTRQVEKGAYSFVQPQLFEKAQLIHVNQQLVSELGMGEIQPDDFLKIMTGQKSYNQQAAYAMCYAGHQFGNWAGQLGDGRAINIAELEVANQPWVLQLKGAGPTPYSRGADGFAVLRSSIREYLMSEAMYHLNVPTTRALSLALSGNQVLRDILYNGNQAYEPGAIVCRAAPTFIRFGNFENFTARGNLDTLKALTDYTIQQFYGHLGKPDKSVYLQFFQDVVNRSIAMVVHWQRVGFVHGVMNTDNMSILGLTIDYGPYGWLENFDPGWTPNTTDAQSKRYRFGNQPSIVHWNLAQLANALYPLIEDAPALQAILDDFPKQYNTAYHTMMLNKLGCSNIQPDDENFIQQLTKILYQSQVDMTLFYRNLALFNPENPTSLLPTIAHDSYLDTSNFEKHRYNWTNWLQHYSARIQTENIPNHERIAQMNRVNPKYVLRNYMAHLAIEQAEKGDYALVETFYNLLQSPYDEQPQHQKWFAKRPDWATEKVGCSMLSCSS